MHANILREIGWHVEGKPDSQIFFRTLGPLTVAKIQRPEVIDPGWLANFRKTHHTITTYIEPGLLTALPTKKLGISVEPFAHSCTSLIDLGKTDRLILDSFSQKTRYNITHTLKKNEIIITTTRLDKLTQDQKNAFFDLHASWSQKKDVIGYPTSLLNAVLKCHGQTGDLHLAYHDRTLVASLLILYHDHVATYYAAFADPLGYKTFAPTLLTWTAICIAKTNGCDIFDFGGIYDPRYPKMYKKWQGFTKFKAGFNPTAISYPPTTLQLFW
jgi:lipid II:glycine glycyltransferase (peptidoglycan interpeptide bridge formation enzyme)